MDNNYQIPDIVKQKALNAENGGALFKFYVEEMINGKSLLDTLVFSWLNYTDAYPPTKYGSQLNRYNEKRKIYVVSFDNWKEAVGLQDWIGKDQFQKTLLKIFLNDNLKRLAKSGLLTDKRCKAYDDTKHKTIEDIDATFAGKGREKNEGEKDDAVSSAESVKKTKTSSNNNTFRVTEDAVGAETKESVEKKKARENRCVNRGKTSESINLSDVTENQIENKKDQSQDTSVSDDNEIENEVVEKANIPVVTDNKNKDLETEIESYKNTYERIPSWCTIIDVAPDGCCWIYILWASTQLYYSKEERMRRQIPESPRDLVYEIRHILKEDNLLSWGNPDRFNDNPRIREKYGFVFYSPAYMFSINPNAYNGCKWIRYQFVNRNHFELVVPETDINAENIGEEYKDYMSWGSQEGPVWTEWKNPEYRQAYEEYKKGRVDAMEIETEENSTNYVQRTPIIQPMKPLPGTPVNFYLNSDGSTENIIHTPLVGQKRKCVGCEEEIKKRQKLEKEKKTLEDRITKLERENERMKKEHEKALQNKEQEVMKMLANTFGESGKTCTFHKYVGQMNLLNQPHGKGLVTLDDGSTYDGEFKNGKREGHGTRKYSDGREYIGDWENGNMEGHGIYTYLNDKKYVGEFKNNKREGRGAYTYPSGSKYVGEWKNGKKEGHGIFTWANGNKYDGEFKNDKREGHGALYNKDENLLYEGQWVDDERAS